MNYLIIHINKIQSESFFCAGQCIIVSINEFYYQLKLIYLFLRR
jgi:hypothetical protein